MKIIHIEGGLGNQMACYAVYVAASLSNPEDEFYFDTYIYDIKEAHSTISMWNGYELKKVFGININDIRILFSDKQVEDQLNYLRQSKFWNHGWNYAQVFTQMMHNYGIELKNAVSRMEDCNQSISDQVKKKLKNVITMTSSNQFTYCCKHLAYALYNNIAKDCGSYLYKRKPGNYYFDITLDFMKSPFLYKTIGNYVKEGLIFDAPNDSENLNYLNLMRDCNSVSVHIRRTDYLQFNEDCYKYGYFKKAINFIKKKVVCPVFFIFSDDLDWCKENLDILGLTRMDQVFFIGINIGDNSYRDMQLMKNCKHNVATKSSFGWWGSFLNENENKITCCQIGSYISTNQF